MPTALPRECRQSRQVSTPKSLLREPSSLCRTSHSTPYTLHPAPCTLHPTPYTLHPTPYTLHPTPYLLPPTSYLFCRPAGWLRAPRRVCRDPEAYTLFTHHLTLHITPQSPQAKTKILASETGLNRLFQGLDLQWRSPESGGLWYTSRQLKKTI